VDEVTVDREKRLLIARPSGIVDVPRCRAIFRALRELEGGERFNRYIDLAGVDEVKMSYDEIWWLARHCSSNWNSTQRARCLIHAERDVLFGIARMFQSLVETEFLTVAVCRSRLEAAVSLGVPLEFLEPAEAT
jgi:hypothetical protein